MFNRSILTLLALIAVPCGAYSATFTVINTNAAGAGSLRQAMLDANASAGADNIVFAIASGGLTISPGSALPVITEAVTIDGSTQAGFTNRPVVEIYGTGAGTTANGLLIASSNCVVRSLAVNGFRGDGIQITNGTGSRVEGCYLGVATDGFTRRGNSTAGVRIAGITYGVVSTSGNVIGGEAAAAHNLISANLYGIWLSDTADNTILGNNIGTDATGAFDVGNTNMGIFVYSDAAYNLIGGTNAAARNLISGNGEPPQQYSGDGIRIDFCHSNSVFGNFIGVDATGTYAIPNGAHGVNIQYGRANLIGGAGLGQSNLISGNLVHGVNLGGFGENSTLPYDYAGTPAPEPDGNIVQGNLIGTDITGQSTIPNNSDGVFIGNMQGNLIGGLLPGEGNVIRFNTNNGVEIVSFGTANNEVAGNTISGNRNIGVLAGYGTTSIAILANSIFANTNLGIDLSGDGVTFNDLGDGDLGANGLQNYPVLGFPIRYGTFTSISGTLNSATNGVFHIELFDNDNPDPTGYGQGQTYLGFVTVTNDGNGNSSFVFTNAPSLPLTHYISATATATNGNTSEFSFARRVVRPDSVDIAVTLADSVDPAPRATSFFYTLTVTNFGPTNATGVFATNILPAGLSFVSAVSSQGGCSQSAGVVTCNIGSLGAGAGAVVTITVNATNTGPVIVNASATSSGFENDPSNNSASESTFLGVADLAVRTSDTPDPVVAGQTVTYTLVATNSGSDPATSATASFNLEFTSFITGAAVSQGTVSAGGNYASCVFGTIPAHGSATLTVTAIPTVVGTANNYANISALEYDPDSSNNNTNEQTVVLAGPGVIQFTQPLYTVNEGGGSALIGVMRTGGTLGTVTVNFATSNLTALAGTDYVATNGTLTFLAGESNKTFSVAILDDGSTDCNQSLRLRLFNPTGGAVLVGQTNATLQIFDNHPVPAGVVQGVSLANTNLVTTGNSASQSPSISDDGRYIAFNSYANNLITTPDNNGTGDVFIRDRTTGINLLVSLNVSNSAANGNSVSPKISADGQRVAYWSSASDLTTNAAFGNTQVYARNLATSLNYLVSVNTNGAAGNNSVGTFALSTNGTKIAFTSYASDLAPGDNNNTYDIFYRDLASNTVSLVSVNSAGTGTGNGYSDYPAISADGRYVAFGSYASNLSPADTNARFDIYRRDMVAGVTALVSANGGGVAGNNSCGNDIFISGDGRFVAFESYDTDLAPGAVFFSQEIYLRDMVAGTNRLVSVNNSNVAASSTCYLRGLSRDGRYVLFESYAGNLFTNDTNFRSEIFLRDTVSNVTMLININLAGNAPGNDYAQLPALSSNGRYVTFISLATDLVAADKLPGVYDVFVRDLQTGATTLLSTIYGGSTGGNMNAGFTYVSDTGVVAFEAYASDLAQVDGNNTVDVFARAPGAGVPELLSKAIGVTGNNYSYDEHISADGSKVAYVSYAANLVPNDTNAVNDVFLRDLVLGTNQLISVNAANNGSGFFPADQPCLSSDGHYVAYHLTLPNDGNGNPTGDIYLRDTVAKTNLLISLNRFGTAGGNGDSHDPEITPDGKFIVFGSTAANLVSNDVNGILSDVFIRNRTNSAVELVSLNAAGTASANGHSDFPTVSDDGRYVAFESFASNLGPADSNSHYDIYVRDRQTGSNILCSPNLAGTSGGNADSYFALISANGRFVTFLSDASNLVAGDTNNATDIFVFDLNTRALQLVSRTPGGVPGNGISGFPSISADGRYVAFESGATNLVANDSNGDLYDVFVRDLIAGTTTLVSVNCAGTSSGNEASYAPQISGNGRYVAFQTYASDLVPGDFSKFTGNILRRDLLAGSTTLVSQNRTLLGGGNNYSYGSSISYSGGGIAFISAASDLILDDANFTEDIFAWLAATNGGSIDLALGKTASAASVAQGAGITYTLAITNYGIAIASGVVVTDALPASLSFVSATSSQGTVANNSGLVTGNVGTLNPGAGLRLTINVTATTAGYVTNTATTAANTSDLNSANNTGSAIVLVTAPAAPALSVMVTNGSQLFLSWPYPSSGYSLETTTNIAPISVWVPVGNSVSNNGLINFLILNINIAEPARFYHLRHP